MRFHVCLYYALCRMEEQRSRAQRGVHTISYGAWPLSDDCVQHVCMCVYVCLYEEEAG